MLRLSPTEKRWKSFISGTKWTKYVSSLQFSLLQNHLHFWHQKYDRILNETQTHWFLLLLQSAPIHTISSSFLLFFQTEWLSHYSSHLVHWAEHCNKFKEITAGQVFTLARLAYMLFSGRRTVWRDTLPRFSQTARGKRPRLAFKTEAKFFFLLADHARWITRFFLSNPILVLENSKNANKQANNVRAVIQAESVSSEGRNTGPLTNQTCFVKILLYFFTIIRMA